MAFRPSIKGLFPAAPVAVSITRPLVDSPMAAVILDCSVDDVTRALHAGLFPFAWDVSEGTRKHALYRVLTLCLASIQQNNPKLLPESYEAAENLIVPYKPITRRDLFRLFSISKSHFDALMDHGRFPRIPAGVGRKPLANVTPDYVRNFLKSNRIE
jgi:hypothetical protein